MNVAARSQERVGDRLDRLEARYDSFPVNQTTMSVATEGYERARERSRRGLADVYVEVYDDDGEVLLVRSDDAWTVPSAQTEAEESLEAAAKREVRETAGVECSIEGIHKTTILGVTDEEDPDRDPVYRLVVVFVARAQDPSIAESDVEWHSEVPDQARP